MDHGYALFAVTYHPQWSVSRGSRLVLICVKHIPLFHIWEHKMELVNTRNHIDLAEHRKGRHYTNYKWVSRGNRLLPHTPPSSRYIKPRDVRWADTVGSTAAGCTTPYIHTPPTGRYINYKWVSRGNRLLPHTPPTGRYIKPRDVRWADTVGSTAAGCTTP